MFKNLDSSDVLDLSRLTKILHSLTMIVEVELGNLVKARSGSQYNYISSSDAITEVV